MLRVVTPSRASSSCGVCVASKSFGLIIHLGFMSDNMHRHLVSVGALVIALGFMVEPFLQAIISDYGLLVDIDASRQNSTSPTIAKSNRFDGGTQCVTTFSSNYPKVDTTPDFAVAAALYDGLNAAINSGYQNVSFTCTSGNCTWTLFTSLAVRSTCFNISSLLKRTTPEDVARTTTSTTRTSSSRKSVSVTTSSISSSKDPPGMYEVASFTHPAPDDSSTLIPDAIASTNTPQTFSEVEAPKYATPPLKTEASAFVDHLTLNSKATPIQSTMIQDTAGLEKRASSSVQSITTPTQSSATWTDWTLEHLPLTLSNTDGQSRKASTFAVLQAAVVADPNLTINFKSSQALLAAFTIIRTDNTDSLGSSAWDAAAASAMECGLELTLNVYNSSVRNNVLVEQVVASASDKVPGSWLPSPHIDQSGIHPNNLPVDPGPLESNPIYHRTFMYRDDYKLDPAALQTNATENFTISQKGLSSTLDFLTSLIRQQNENATVKAVVQTDQSVLYTYGSAILQPLLNQTNTTATFDAIAKSMSNAIRNIGNETVSGTAQKWVRHYHIRWGFLTLPLSLITSKSHIFSHVVRSCTDHVLSVGSIFFVLSILDARRLGIPSWKANSIATMVHGPDKWLHQHLRDKNHQHLRDENHAHSLGQASETVASLERFREGYALIATNEPLAQISRPTTPVRDEEEHEMSDLNIPPTPQTPGSNITLVEPQSVEGASDQGTIKSVSSIRNGPDWSDIQIDGSSTPPSVRRSA